MEEVYYFAFGSNMDPKRMQERVPAARGWGRAKLQGWVFVCNKSGMDGTAKANLQPSAEGLVWGVVYRLDAKSLPELDVFEGGYERLSVEVLSEQHGLLKCEVYVSDRLTADPRPAAWYKQHMVAGADAHQFPEHYVSMLRALPVVEAE